MSSPESAAPGPLTQRALALQERQRTVNEFISQAMSMVAGKPADAYPLLAQAYDMAESMYREQEDFLRQMEPWGPAQIPQLQQDAGETRLQIRLMQGQAASQLLRPAEARAFYEQALALIGDRSHPAKPMILMAMAEVEAGSGPGPV